MLQDALLAAVIFLIRVDGRWDLHTAPSVCTWHGGCLGAIFHLVGALIVTAASWPGGFHGQPTRLTLYMCGSFCMHQGAALLARVMSQVIQVQAAAAMAIKQREVNAKQQAARASDFEPIEDMDGELFRSPMSADPHELAGKATQLQALVRYSAAAFAPLVVSFCLIRLLPLPALYPSISALAFVPAALLAAWLTDVSDPPQADAPINNTLDITDTSDETWKESSTRRGGTSRSGVSWLHCAVMSVLTELLLCSYSRLLCLRALAAGSSFTQLASALVLARAAAAATFWLADIAIVDRRLAATLSFAVLTAGHFGLAIVGDNFHGHIEFYRSSSTYVINYGIKLVFAVNYCCVSVGIFFFEELPLRSLPL